jgi:Na+/melibiose symporter-like transporter
MAQTAATVTEQPAVGNQGEAKKLLFGYSMTQFGSGVWKSYFSTYIAMLYTDIYLFPVLLAGALELFTQFLNWASGPLFGTMVDRITFKTGKYWQWIGIGCVCVAGVYAIIFGIPTVVANPTGIAFLIFILATVRAIGQPMCDVTLVSVYPKLGKTPKERTNLAAGKALGLRVGQTLGGFITPVLLTFFALHMSEKSSWFSTALVLAIIGVVSYLIFVVFLRKSSVEAAAVAERNFPRRKKVSLTVALRSLLANRALMVMFLFMVVHKFYYFLQTYTASYFYKYFVDDFALQGTFTSAKQLSQVAGVFLGIYLLKILKDSKRAFVVSGFAHIAALGLSMMFTHSAWGFIILSAAHSLFAGMMEAFILPFFAAACDYGTWKTGARADGLNMSVYTLALSIASAVSIAARAFMLNNVGYDAKIYVDNVMPPQNILDLFANFQALYPFLLSIVAVLLVLFFFPLNDTTLTQIRSDLKAREEAEAAGNA